MKENLEKLEVAAVRISQIGAAARAIVELEGSEKTHCGEDAATTAAQLSLCFEADMENFVKEYEVTFGALYMRVHKLHTLGRAMGELSFEIEEDAEARERFFLLADILLDNVKETEEAFNKFIA